MLTFLLQRLMQILALLFAMSLVVFFGVYAIGDPIEMLVDPNLGQEARDEAVRLLGLDRPLFEQYATYLEGLLQGDFGRSFIYGESALRIILERAPATFELAFAAMLIAIVLGIPLGIVAGRYPDRFRGRAVLGGSILGFSLPSFWVGLMLNHVLRRLPRMAAIRRPRADPRRARRPPQRGDARRHPAPDPARL